MGSHRIVLCLEEPHRCAEQQKTGHVPVRCDHSAQSERHRARMHHGSRRQGGNSAARTAARADPDVPRLRNALPFKAQRTSSLFARGAHLRRRRVRRGVPARRSLQASDESDDRAVCKNERSHLARHGEVPKRRGRRSARLPRAECDSKGARRLRVRYERTRTRGGLSPCADRCRQDARGCGKLHRRSAGGRVHQLSGQFCILHGRRRDLFERR